MVGKERQQTRGALEGGACFKHLDRPDAGYKAAS